MPVNTAAEGMSKLRQASGSCNTIFWLQMFAENRQSPRPNTHCEKAAEAFRTANHSPCVPLSLLDESTVQLPRTPPFLRKTEQAQIPALPHQIDLRPTPQASSGGVADRMCQGGSQLHRMCLLDRSSHLLLSAPHRTHPVQVNG